MFRRSTLIGSAIAFCVIALPVGIAYAADAHESVLAYDLNFTETQPAAPAPAAIETAPVVAAIDPASLECMAKVVHHESRGQPRRGQMAVAQTLINRMNDDRGRFGETICEVANQRGQFFNIAAYRPDRDSDGWEEAVEVSRAALSGEAEDAAPGAKFFHASYASRNAFFRTRPRVTQIGGQVFYR